MKKKRVSAPKNHSANQHFDKRLTEFKHVPLASLHEDPANARKHGSKNLDAIRGSLLEFGQVEPLVIQKSTRKVIGGNGRLGVMRQLGWTHAKVFEFDCDNAQATALGIALNRTAELAEWDQEALDKLLATVQVNDADFQVMFEELKTVQIQDGLTDPDTVPEPPDEAITQPGDLWVLGEHRLLCADSSKPEDVDRLLDGAEIHLVNTDPPYGVGVQSRSNNSIAAGLSSFKGAAHHQKLDVVRHPGKARATTKKLRAKDRPLANDFLSDEDFERLLDAWFGNVARVLGRGRAFFIWGGYGNLGNYPPVLKKHGLYFSQGIIWDKQHPVLTRKDFMGCFEIAYYGWREGAAHQFFGPNNALDLWHLKKINPQNMVHLTEKPVELAERAMQYSSRPGENVLDLFGGSGSTLIAAERTGRRAYLLELDALYVDIIVTRWEQFTGKKAERLAA
jgi:DNA modification methylase